ncbi:MAG: hypothetical protein VX822_02505 [Candidatus Neomarinimicrobiota bacterium]|nr:hypothetical protein [Candidatus Neomarinimicrobiota bacterium]
MLTSNLPAQADINYEPWDWVTHRFSQHVVSISDGRDHVYFASPGGVLQYHSFGHYWDHPITPSQGLSDFSVTAVYYDLNTNILWAATPKGLDFSTDGGGRWSHVPRENLGLRNFEKIIRIGSTADELYCVTSSQILKIDRFSGFLLVPYSGPPSEEETRWGSYPLRAGDSARDFLDGYTALGGWTLELDSFNGPSLNESARILSVHTDRFGDLWIGTEGGPVFHGNRQMMLLEPKSVGLSQNNVKAIEEWGNELWLIGIEDSGRYTGFTLMGGRPGSAEVFREGIEITVGIDQAGAVIPVKGEWWFGTTEGIQKYDPESDIWSRFTRAVPIIDQPITHLKSDGIFVYVGHRRGLLRINVEKSYSEPWSLPAKIGQWPIDALEWDGANLWVSSGRRLWRWLADAEFTYEYGSFGEDLTGLKRGEPPLMSPITSIVSSDSTVYFADEFGLLMYEKSSGRWDRFTAESQLVGLKTLDLEVVSLDDTTTVVWFGTMNGAVVTNLQNGFFDRFSVKDGLPAKKVNAVHVRGDDVFFGTDEGLCRFKWKRYLQ